MTLDVRHARHDRHAAVPRALGAVGRCALAHGVGHCHRDRLGEAGGDPAGADAEVAALGPGGADGVRFSDADCCRRLVAGKQDTGRAHTVTARHGESNLPRGASDFVTAVDYWAEENRIVDDLRSSYCRN